MKNKLLHNWIKRRSALNNAISAIFLIAIITNSIAQNLVVNPSFEITNSNCSNFGGEGFRTDLDPSWDNANSNIPGDSCSSPDLFSACNPFATNMPDATSFGIGWQYSRTGTRHAGFIAYSAPFGFEDQYREYIQGHTTSPLIAGQTYCVSFYLSLADGSPFAVEDIGVHFTNSHYLRDACTQGSLLNLVPQLENNCGVLSDTMNWVRLQWDYVATGGEQYFIIGNFKNDANTNHTNANGNGFGNYFAYYFLDDVSIVSNNCCYTELDGPTSLCPADGLTQYTASPGINPCGTSITGTWSGTAINSVTGVFDPNAAGMGTHTLTFNADCGTSTSIDVTVAPCMDVCLESNGDLTVNGGTGPFEWSEWDLGGSTPITNQTQCQSCGYTWFFGNCLDGVMPVTSCNTPAGYQVFATGTTVTPSSNFPIQVEDAFGSILIINNAGELSACTVDPCASVTINMVVDNQNNVSCFGGSNGSATVSASGGTAPYSYFWNPGNLNGPTQGGLSAGTYLISIQDNAGCTGNGTVTITEPTELVASASGNDASCGNNDGSATASQTGGTGGYTYSWSPSGGTGITANNLAPGAYTVTITDALGCTDDASVTISTTNGPTISVDNFTDVSCFGGTNGTATVSATGGTSGYTYTWQPGNLSGANQSSLSAGNYTVEVEDVSGCTDFTSVTIGEPTDLVLGQGAILPADCGSANGEATVNVSGGTGPYTYSWSPSGGSAATATGLTGGSYTVTVTDNNLCTDNLNFTVPTSGGPTITVDNTQDVSCFGDTDGSATVSATGGTTPYTYSWSPSGGNAATASGLGVGSYDVTVTDDGGCISVETIVINGPSALQISSTVTDENCGQGDGSISLNVSGGTPTYTYLWSPGAETTSSINSLTPGNYSVTVTDAAGCEANDNFTINSVGSIPVNVTPSTATIEAGDQVLLSASGATSYSWTPTTGLSCTSCANPVASPTVTTTYIVTGTDASGCTGSDTVTIYVQVNCADLFVPTIFSPNGTGPAANELLCVHGTCITSLTFRVFNRWGEVVFETESAVGGTQGANSTVCWDGTFRGKEVQSGTYVYTINAQLFDNTIIEESGNLTLVR